ncbi:AAA family ATPase [Neorhizobium tomejilense]|uniref:AAA family ATPase n=1 Tax=Neorhizobium tomejilense TaxID=2093828 RepID=UPI001FDEBFDE|nr:AAA family ATPase [Neorhizobium tomejilense]
MTRRHYSDPAITLEVVACSFAIKPALRKGDVFRRLDATVGLVLPKDTKTRPYKDAIWSILRGKNLHNEYVVVTIEETRRGEHHWFEAADALEAKEAVVVVIPNGAWVPPHVAIALDHIVRLDDIRPAHLAAAIYSATGSRVSVKDAKMLLGYPRDLMFGAFRRGRPFPTAVARLEAFEKDEPEVEVGELGVGDLSGFGDAKDWALDLALDLRDWKEGNIRWSDVDRGLLLSGPPGVGKTMFAAAVARTCGASFMETSTAQWQAAGHLGDFLKAMRRTFREAAETAPTILFIDEFDAVGDRSKFSGDNAHYGVQVVNGLLEALDGAKAREGVVVIAATNHPDTIDPALRRPGRLDRHVSVALPDYDDRKNIVSLHLGGDLPSEAIAAAARATTGYSGADLAQLAKDARRIARRNRRKVEARDLVAVTPPILAVPQETRWAAAIHEAGHAIVGLELRYGSVAAIVLPREVPARGDCLGQVEWNVTPDRHRSESSYRDQVAMLMAGIAAEKAVLGQSYSGAGGGSGSDLQRATDLATMMVACLGMGSLTYHHADTQQDLADLRKSDPTIRKLVEDLLTQELKRSITIIERLRSSLDLLAEALITTEVLTGDQISKILASRHRS